jgi:Ni,Fe-hydrogenase III small subunit
MSVEDVNTKIDVRPRYADLILLMIAITRNYSERFVNAIFAICLS